MPLTLFIRLAGRAGLSPFAGDASDKRIHHQSTQKWDFGLMNGAVWVGPKANISWLVLHVISSSNAAHRPTEERRYRHQQE